jgi:hypothetical protein
MSQRLTRGKTNGSRIPEVILRVTRADVPINDGYREFSVLW